ncbi:hypothetical protein XENTR_v10010068 [Xenopus tropicalis]|nr:hypothetical protein XENTR_v10010068 [Xenopus tropicalis]
MEATDKYGDSRGRYPFILLWPNLHPPHLLLKFNSQNPPTQKSEGVVKQRLKGLQVGQSYNWGLQYLLCLEFTLPGHPWC